MCSEGLIYSTITFTVSSKYFLLKHKVKGTLRSERLQEGPAYHFDIEITQPANREDTTVN